LVFLRRESAQPALRASAGAKPGTSAGEWRSYGGDLASALRASDQINRDNFNKLEVAWRFKTDAIRSAPEINFEGTPLMAGGVLYATVGTRRAVVALNPATGELLWSPGGRRPTRRRRARADCPAAGSLTGPTEETRGYCTSPWLSASSRSTPRQESRRALRQKRVVDLSSTTISRWIWSPAEVGLHAARSSPGMWFSSCAHLPGGAPKRMNNEKG